KLLIKREDGQFHAQFTLTAVQRDNLLAALPQPFQQRCELRMTWLQTYNTGATLQQFVQNAAGDWVPNWGPNVGQWYDYSFLPATYRFLYSLESFQNAYTVWENIRDLVWV
ncbi:hypothetical protein DFQ27_002028, partial [Actinomortierella ambigua]